MSMFSAMVEKTIKTETELKFIETHLVANSFVKNPIKLYI